MSNFEVKTLAQKLKLVQSCDDYIEFALLLQKDFQSNPENWNNESIGDGIGAASAWLEDAIRCGHITSSEASWSLFANILYAMKVYE